MPKVVRRDVRHAGFGDRFDEPPACRRAVASGTRRRRRGTVDPRDPGPRTGGPDRAAGTRAAARCAVCGPSACRRGSPCADLDGVLRHRDPPAQHVEIAHPQPDRLTPPQAGVGQQQHQPLVVRPRRRPVRPPAGGSGTPAACGDLGGSLTPDAGLPRDQVVETLHRPGSPIRRGGVRFTALAPSGFAPGVPRPRVDTHCWTAVGLMSPRATLAPPRSHSHPPRNLHHRVGRRLEVTTLAVQPRRS